MRRNACAAVTPGAVGHTPWASPAARRLTGGRGPWIATTSSSSVPAPAAERSRTAWLHRQAHPAARARRVRAAGEGELGLARGDEARYNIGGVARPPGKEFHAGAHYCVGGNTKFYGAALIRMRREDFGVVRHHGGISPAWPIAYEDLEPYYTQAEHLYQVHGLRGSDPTEPAASAPYLHPPLSHEPRIQEIVDGLARRAPAVPCRSASCSTSATRGRAAASAATPATASHASSTPRPTRR